MKSLWVVTNVFATFLSIREYWIRAITSMYFRNLEKYSEPNQIL